MNIEHVGKIFVIIAYVFVDAIDRAYAYASGIDAINAKPGNRPRHKSKSSPYVAPFTPPFCPFTLGEEWGAWLLPASSSQVLI
jgi:hypothetical protein